MRIVNLSRRPFVNRRPIVRLAVLLWVAGAALLAVNVYLYTSHWLGSAASRGELGEVRGALAAQQQLLAEKSQKFQRLSLDKRNRRAAFLNRLIDARTFPWSALFDDLEQVLPEGVRLITVRPAVKLASGQRTREQTTGGRESKDGELAQDEVQLRLNGYARSFDQLDVFVNRLFDPPFRNPNLSNATFAPAQGAGTTAFSIFAVYQTRRAPLEDPADAGTQLAESAGDEPPAAGSGEPGAEVEGQAAAAPGTATPGAPPSPGGDPTLRTATEPAEPDPSRADPSARLSRPGQSRPGSIEPGQSRPGLSRPGQTRPGQAGPGRGDRSQTGIAALPDRPVPTAPEAAPTNPDRPGRDRPSRDRPGRDRPGRDRPSRDRPSPPPPRGADESEPSRETPTREPEDDNPSFGDRDASSTPGVRPRRLGVLAPAAPWEPWRLSAGLLEGSVPA